MNKSSRSVLSLALGLNGIIRKDIDGLYNEDPVKYSKVYRESDMYQHVFEANLQIEKALNMRKASSLIMYLESLPKLKIDEVNRTISRDTTKVDTIYKLMKKGYKRMHQLVQNSDVVVDARELMLPFKNQIEKAQETGRADNSLSTMDLFNQITAMKYFIKYHNKREFESSWVESFYFGVYKSMSKPGSLIESIVEEGTETFKKEIRGIRNKYLPVKGSEIYLEDIWDSIRHNEDKELAKRYPRYRIGTGENQIQGKKTQALEMLTSVTTGVGILSDYINQPFTQKDLNKACMLLHIQVKGEVLTEDVEAFYLYQILHMQAISKEYKLVRDAYMAGSQENDILQLQQLELDKKEQQLEINYKEIESMKQEVLQREQQAQKRIAEQNEYIRRLEKQTVQLQNEAAKVQSMTHRIQGLTQQVEGLKQELRKVKTKNKTTDEMLQDLQNIEIKIVGGYPGWMQKTLAFLPRAQEIDLDGKGRDLTNLRNFQGVLLINTAYDSHTFVEKTLRNVSNNAIIVYIDSHLGKDRVVKEIHDAVSKRYAQ